MSNQGFKPRKLHGSLPTKLKKFQELYEEIMEEIQVKPSVKTELQSLSPRTFTRLVYKKISRNLQLKNLQNIVYIVTSRKKNI